MAKQGRAWKLERAVVHRTDGMTRSHRYSKNDGPRPLAGTRKQYWHPGNQRLSTQPPLQGQEADRSPARSSTQRLRQTAPEEKVERRT